MKDFNLTLSVDDIKAIFDPLFSLVPDNDLGISQAFALENDNLFFYQVLMGYRTIIAYGVMGEVFDLYFFELSDGQENGFRPDFWRGKNEENQQNIFDS